MVTPTLRHESFVFKTLAAPSRLRALRVLLTSDRALCSSELADRLGLPRYAVSKHLKQIHAAGLVIERREGRHVYYTACHQDGAFLRAIHGAIAALEQPLVGAGHDS